ncbi:MAG: ParB N-terminal domain-containing protein [Spirochaetaceae bacterium]|jgi:ParB family chromosome partitioning protein|nr:ParB N-terminal domain-containing protein [Spirochaetaceae bacterium]
MQVPIEDIKVKKRIRKDLGNIEELAESMRRFGQLNPITITRKNVLIAGGRRLEAARRLGWHVISAEVLDVSDKVSVLELEIEENLQRQDFSPGEISEAAKELDKLKHPGFFRKIWNALAKLVKKIFRIEH